MTDMTLLVNIESTMNNCQLLIKTEVRRGGGGEEGYIHCFTGC